MRTLERNKRSVWYVRYLGLVDVIDEDGCFTGETRKEYSEPKEIKLNLYTSSSEIVNNTFGTTNNIDIICSNERVKLEKSDKLFYDKPEDDVDYESEFDLELTAISESLNHYNYGFRSRE